MLARQTQVERLLRIAWRAVGTILARVVADKFGHAHRRAVPTIAFILSGAFWRTIAMATF